MDKILKLKEIINDSTNIVFFGGAGVSTESGIPDFRSVDGLYNQKFDYPPEEILSHEFFFAKTQEFYDFYRAKMIAKNVKPNDAHIALCKLEKEGKLKAVITQNIDGLHQLAGSKIVYELHGTTLKNECLKCGKKFSVDKIIDSDGVPRCECGGIIKPEVVLYGESLPDEAVAGAVHAIRRADTLIVAGTSLTVYPAAGLINYFKGKNLVLINRDETQYDYKADLVIREKVGVVLKKAVLDE